jgi:hypothetical protein
MAEADDAALVARLVDQLAERIKAIAEDRVTSGKPSKAAE